MVEKISNGVDDINLTAMISECNMAGNPKEWWIDIGATRHICANRSMFSSYTTMGGDEKLYMGNSSTSKVEGVGKIALRLGWKRFWEGKIGSKKIGKNRRFFGKIRYFPGSKNKKKLILKGFEPSQNA